jgi:hypothetical protein
MNCSAQLKRGTFALHQDNDDFRIPVKSKTTQIYGHLET